MKHGMREREREQGKNGDHKSLKFARGGGRWIEEKNRDCKSLEFARGGGRWIEEGEE
jgi:hypothetical protein